MNRPRPAVAGAADRTAALPQTGLLLLATLAVQFMLQSYFFPLDALLTATPLSHIDAFYHQYQMGVAQALCAQHRLVGFDPFFSAGHLGGVTFNASAKLPALLACMAGAPQAIAPIYKLFSFGMGVLAPAGLVLAAAWLGFDRRATAVTAFFALVFWWTGPIRWYHTAGLVSYAATAYLAIPLAVAAVRACASATAKRVAAVAAGCALGTLLHPLFPVALCLAALPLAARLLGERGVLKRAAVVTVAAVAATLLLNGAWFYASLGAPTLANAQPYQRAVDPLLVVHELLGVAPTAAGGSRLYALLVLGAVAGLWLSTAARRSSLVALVAAFALLMAWASVGALEPHIAALQPNRFSALAWLVLCLPAAWGTVALWDAARRPAQARRWIPRSALVAVALLGVYAGREVGREIFSSSPQRYAVTRPEVKGVGATSRAIIDFLRTRTDLSGRVFFENSLGRVHDGAHTAGLYAMAADRELIGGPYPYTDFASAWDGQAFGRDLAGFGAGDLVRLLDLYNIKWMLCHTAGCRKAMSALPGSAAVAELGPVTAYQRSARGSYFVSGTGSVARRCMNRLDLRIESKGEVVLKYHWVPGLVATPATRIEARTLEPGARPFIALIDAPPEVTLSAGPASPKACGAGAPA